MSATAGAATCLMLLSRKRPLTALTVRYAGDRRMRRIAPFPPLPLGLWNGEVAWRAAVVACRGSTLGENDSVTFSREAIRLLILFVAQQKPSVGAFGIQP
jgi:hypothetical protein